MSKKDVPEVNLENNSDEEQDTVDPLMQEKYNPTISSNIICIELENNQYLYLNYTENSTIKDLILDVLKRREYKLLYQERNNILYSLYENTIYDLNLCFYDSIKPPYDNKISLDTIINDLHTKGLLKNHYTPFLNFKQNYMTFSYINTKKKYTTEPKTKNFFENYTNYLPRQIKNVPNILISHPELEDYFQRNKKGYNEFKEYKRNKLTCEDDKIDWLIYDKESISFLLKMNKMKFTEISNLKYINGTVYFEDKCKFNDDKRQSINSSRRVTISNAKLTDSKLEKVLINLIIDVAKPGDPPKITSKKFAVNANTTAYDLIEKMRNKLSALDQNLNFDVNTKILKALSLNDYIFDVKEPLINYTYFNECVKLNKSAEYLILDNPALIDTDFYEENVNNTSFTDINRSSMMPVISGEEPDLDLEGRKTRLTMMPKPISIGKNDLYNIASYNSAKNNINDDIENISEVLNKEIIKGNIEKENNKNNLNLINLIDNIEKDIKNNVEEKYKNELTKEINIEKDIFENDLGEDDDEEINDNNIYENEDTSTEINKKTVVNSYTKTFGFLDLNPNGSELFENKKIYNIQSKNNNKNSIEILKYNIPKNLTNKEEINITKIDRKFSIMFRSAYIDTLLNSCEFETRFTTTTLLFKFQLFCANQPISSAKHIRWTTNKDVQNPIFNKRIYFERYYKEIPNSCSIIFIIKFLQYNKNKQLIRSTNKYWANYRLFSFDNKLKVGLHKVNLHKRDISDDTTDDIYYNFTENPDEEKSSKIYFEIENFSQCVVYKIPKYKENSFEKSEPNLYEITPDDLLKISKISEKSLFEELNNYEKEALWNNRLGVSKMTSFLPRLLLSCDYRNPNTNLELQKIFKLSAGVSLIQAIELLTGRYVNDLIREFAVNILKKATYSDISHYLLQLVQALKYEKNIDNPLARFLLEQAITHPITVGHEFFWHLRAEMFNPNVQRKFGLYLEVFVNKISIALYKIFKDEDFLLKELTFSAVKVQKDKNQNDRVKNFRNDIKKLNKELKNKKKEISLPLNFKYRIKGIIAEKCRVMKSKKKPLWLTFENADPMGENIVVMLKCGDDLRMDMVTMQLFTAMQTIWFENGLKVKMSLYKILCTGNMQGMLEMVTNAETLAGIHIKEGGAISQFFFKSIIKNWLTKNLKNVSMEEATENFLLSNVAYCLATFVLGIGDRHNDNIMIKTNGELFHIDFGHFLGHFKYKMGIKRERAPFVFTRQFQNVLGDDNSPLFIDFKKKLIRGYMILRNNKEAIVTLLKILLCTGIPELNEKSLRFLEGSLSMRRKDKEATAFIEKQLSESLDSVSTKLNFAIHIVANK